MTYKMTHSMKILSSKLSAPRTRGTIVRDRLLSLVDLTKGKKLTTVVAGAGYGKTTLAAQALSRWSGKSVWYRLDASDRDLATFLSYLVAGLRRFEPEFGAELLAFLQRTHNPASELKTALTLFLIELERVFPEDLIIVLDDYHAVDESLEIRQTLEIFLRDLPASTRLVLTTRSRPALPLSRLRAMRDVIDIRERDLAFSAEEIDRLFSEVFGFSLDRAEIDSIWNKVGGWVSGLMLLCHSLREKSASEVGANLLGLRGSRRMIFSYLEENVYGSLLPGQQEFLIKTSIFPRFTAAFCNALLKVDYAADLLRYLESNHLFTSSIDQDEDWYSYHQLFRDFLLSRLQDRLDRASFMELHRQAALILEINGEEDEAVGLYLKAGDFERACTILKHAGRRLFGEGRFQLLDSYLSLLPPEALDKHPWTRFQRAQLSGLSGNLDSALKMYGEALLRFKDQGDAEGHGNCLAEMGLIDFQAGDLSGACRRFLALLEFNDLDPKLEIEISGYLIYILSHLGQIQKADRYFERAILRAKGVADKALRYQCLIWLHYYKGFRHAFAGDYDGVLEEAETMKAISREMDDPEPPPGSYLLVSIACFNLQRYSTGFDSAEQALTMLGDGNAASGEGGAARSAWPSPRPSPRGERGFPDVLRCWLLAYAALNGAELGIESGILEYAEESLMCFRKMGCRYGEPFACFVLHEVHLKAGNEAAAERYLRMGVEAAGEMTTPSYEALLKLRFIRFLLEKGESSEALQALNATEASVRNLMHPVFLNLLLSRLYCDDPSKGLDHLICALELCRNRGLDHLLISERNWILPLLVEVFSRGRFQSYIARIISEMGAEASSLLGTITRCGDPDRRRGVFSLLRELRKLSARSLEVNLFGKFKVVVDGRVIPSSSWKSRKAKTLFQYLIYSRRRGYTNKEILMELLWPEEDPALTLKRFHVALASFRKTLEPEIEKGIPSAFISRLGDSYGIELGEDGSTDIEKFSEELKLAVKDLDPQSSFEHLLKAESYYGGEFLQEEPYAEWCLDARDGYRRDYLGMLKRIMSGHELQGNYAQAISYANKCLDVDKYAEDVCRSLMYLYGKTGDKASMARVFKDFRQNMAKELNCPLSDETESLYRKLLECRP